MGELYELGGPGVESEGLVGVVFTDDALGVVFLDPGLTGVGELDFYNAVTPSSTRGASTIIGTREKKRGMFSVVSCIIIGQTRLY